ncbi:hypothetical protein AgCh_005104 [Apium graveolens]
MFKADPFMLVQESLARVNEIRKEFLIYIELSIEDLYYPHPLIQDILWGTLHKVVEPFLMNWPGKKLREKPLCTVMGHIHYEDENTRYICIGPVNKRLSGSSLLILENKQDIQGGLSPDEIAKVTIDAPGGFLFEWRSVFWDIFIARTNEKHSEVIASYIEGHLNENFSALENFGQSNNMEFYVEEALNLFFERTGNVLTEMEQEL